MMVVSSIVPAFATNDSPTPITDPLVDGAEVFALNYNNSSKTDIAGTSSVNYEPDKKVEDVKTNIEPTGTESGVCLCDNNTEIQKRGLPNCSNEFGIQSIQPITKDVLYYNKDVFLNSISDDLVEEGVSEGESLGVISGTCGESAEWILEDNVLHISGSGAIDNYSESPWIEYVNNIQKIIVDDGIIAIGGNAFSGLKNLEEVKLPDGIEKIGYRAFNNCENLKEINIPLSWNDCPTMSSDGTINSNYCGHIFEGCEALTSVTLPEGMVSIPKYAFCHCDYLQEINLPSTLTEIKSHAFYNCSLLKSIEIPDGITTIYKSTFCGCESLTDITIPDSVTEIMLYAFDSCRSLEEAKLPDSIEKIGYRAFNNCENLKEINIPLSWNDCPTMSSDGTINSDYCGHIFEGCKLLTSVTLPEGMVSIPKYAFCYSNYLTQIIIPNTLESIEKAAFYNCSSLVYVGLPESLKFLDEYSFAECIALRAVVFPKSLNSISEKTFEGCKSLAAISIPKNITSIAESSFNSCDLLSHIYYEGTEDEWNSLISVNASGTKQLKAGTNVSGQFQNASVSFGILCDYAEPDFIKEKSYTQPSGENYTDFYGGNAWESGHDYVDVDEASLGKDRHKMFVSLPKDSFITFGFKNAMLCPDDTAILITTTGNVNERADVYLQTLNGGLSFIDTIYEDSEMHTVSLSGIDDLVTGIKVVGRDLDGDSPGFDIVNIALIAEKTDYKADKTTKTTIHLQRGGKTYNLLETSQDFMEGDTEKASLLVSADWGSYNQGLVCLVQNNEVIAQNAGGSFVDIQPGKLFSKSDSIFVVLLDDKNALIERKKIKLTVSGESHSRMDLSTIGGKWIVYQNTKKSTDPEDKYILFDGCNVLYSTNSKQTNKSGIIKLPENLSGNVTFKKEGYVTRNLTVEQLAQNKDIYIQKKNDKGPVISGVWADNVDVLNNEYYLSMISKEKTTLDLEIDWGKSSYGSVKLIQDQRSTEFSGDRLTMVISDRFDTSSTIYIQATDNDGRTTKRPLNFVNSTSNKTSVDWLKDYPIAFNDKISIKLPDNFRVKFLAGSEFGVGLSGLSTLIPVTVAAEDGKLSVVFGLDLFSAEKKGNIKDFKKTSRVKKESDTFISKFKKTGILDGTGSKESFKKFKNFTKELKKYKKNHKGTFGFECDFTILGFIEGTYDQSGNVKLLNSGLILNPSGSVSRDWPFVINAGPIPIPLYFEASFSLEALGQINVRLNKQAKNFIPNGELSGEAELAGGLGIGIKKVLYASGGLAGKLKPDWKIVIPGTDHFTLKASLNAYAKAGIACFEGKLDFEPIVEGTWIEYPKPDQAKSNPSAKESPSFIGNSNMSDFKLKDLSYFKEGSSFTANNTYNQKPKYTVKSRGVGSSSTVAPIKTNIYRESTPQFVELNDGTKIAVWIDSESTDINKVYLYYSVFNEGVWSEPECVFEDGTMDFEPCLKKVGDKVILVWQNANKAFEESTSLGLDDISAYFDISAAVFDQDKKTFATSQIRYDNLDLLPVVGGDKDNIILAWINNSMNDWIGDNGNNSILYSTFDGNNWSEPVVAYKGLNSIGNIAVDYDSKLNISYSMDTDSDINTIEDYRVFENGEIISGNYKSSSPIYFDHELYWFSNNNVVNSKSVRSEGSLASDNYQIISVNGRKAMLYIESEGLYSKLMIAYFNTETDTWGIGMPLTDGSKYIGSFSASSVDGNTLDVLINSTEVIGDFESDNPYGKANLELISVNEYYDISLDNIYYVDDEFCAGQDMPLTIEITNNGNQPVTNTKVQIRDDNRNMLAEYDIPDEIVPGESIEKTIYLSIGENVTSQKLIVDLLPSCNDSDMDNNYQELDLHYEGIFAENTSCGYTTDGKVSISSDIVNRGYNIRDGIIVSLVKGSEDGETITTIETAPIEPLNCFTTEFELQAEQNDVYYILVKDKSTDDIIDSDYVTVYTDYAGKDPYDISSAEITGVVNKTYTGKEITQNPVVKVGDVTLAEGIDYRVTYRNNYNAGTATVTFMGIGDYIGSVDKTFIINPANIADKGLKLSKKSYIYTGSKIKPIPKGDGLTNNVDYKLTFKSNKNVGTASVIASGIGNYKGNWSTTFKINPKGTRLTTVIAKPKAITVKWNKQSTKMASTRITGYQIQLATNSKFTKGKKTVTVSGYSKVSKKVTGLKAKQTYYVRIRTYKTVNGTKYYSKWSAKKSIKTN